MPITPTVFIRLKPPKEECPGIYIYIYIYIYVCVCVCVYMAIELFDEQVFPVLQAVCEDRWLNCTHMQSPSTGILDNCIIQITVLNITSLKRY